MENGGVELSGVMQLENRSLKERLIRAIFRPSIVPCIDIGVMECIALGFALIPLHAGMQDIQNIVKRTSDSLLKMDIRAAHAWRRLKAACF